MRIRITHMETLVLLFLVGEVTVLDVLYVAAYCVGDDLKEVGVAAQETGAELIVHAEHIGTNQHLTVAAATGTDTDDRN